MCCGHQADYTQRGGIVSACSKPAVKPVDWAAETADLWCLADPGSETLPTKRGDHLSLSDRVRSIALWEYSTAQRSPGNLSALALSTD